MMSANFDVLIKVVNVLGGEEAVQVVKALKTLDEATDDQISAETGVRLNSVRKILYKLYECSLVTVKRLRDEKTGWFIFRWCLQSDQLEGFIRNQKRKILEKLEARLEYETNHEFYYCNNPECERVPFEEAVERVFRCPTCGRSLQYFDNSQTIKVLTKRIEKLREELSE